MSRIMHSVMIFYGRSVGSRGLALSGPVRLSNPRAVTGSWQAARLLISARNLLGSEMSNIDAVIAALRVCVRWRAMSY